MLFKLFTLLLLLFILLLLCSVCAGVWSNEENERALSVPEPLTLAVLKGSPWNECLSAGSGIFALSCAFLAAFSFGDRFPCPAPFRLPVSIKLFSFEEKETLCVCLCGRTLIERRCSELLRALFLVLLIVLLSVLFIVLFDILFIIFPLFCAEYPILAPFCRLCTGGAFGGGECVILSGGTADGDNDRTGEYLSEGVCGCATEKDEKGTDEGGDKRLPVCVSVCSGIAIDSGRFFFVFPAVFESSV